MIGRRAFASIVLSGLMWSLGAETQQQPTAIVESEGQAKVAVVPDEIRFEFTKSFDGPTLIDAAAQSAVFEKAVTQALNDLDSTPTRQDPVRLRVPGIGKAHATALIHVSYPMPADKPATGEIGRAHV